MKILLWTIILVNSIARSHNLSMYTHTHTHTHTHIILTFKLTFLICIQVAIGGMGFLDVIQSLLKESRRIFSHAEHHLALQKGWINGMLTTLNLCIDMDYIISLNVSGMQTSRVF